MIRFSLTEIWLLLFLIPITLYCITIAISFISSTRKRRIKRLRDHLRIVAKYQPQDYPSVDVFLPTAGEPLEVLANTYKYVSQLTWPGTITVWVLDDSGRREVNDLANDYGFIYRVRPDRGRMKKAGNLRYGYEQSNSDYIAVFDADFVPRSDFLSNLIPYFEDPSVGIVQSPQFFDARKGMNWLQRSAGPPRSCSIGGSNQVGIEVTPRSALELVPYIGGALSSRAADSPRSVTAKTSTPA